MERDLVDLLQPGGAGTGVREAERAPDPYRRWGGFH